MIPKYYEDRKDRGKAPFYGSLDGFRQDFLETCGKHWPSYQHSRVGSQEEYWKPPEAPEGGYATYDDFKALGLFGRNPDKSEVTK